MNIRKLTLAIILLAVCCAAATQTRPARAQGPEVSPRLQKVLDDAVRVALERFKDKGLAEKNLAVTVVDLTNAGAFERASFRGSEPIYPASVVK
jgi:hypothetical protein